MTPYFTYPAIDPIALALGPLKIHWYGIAYVAGILIGWFCCQRLIKQPGYNLTAKHIDEFAPWAVLGVIAGGRLGHVIFYGGTYYLENPLEIFMIWHPGMSFHGGLLGVVIAMWWFTRKHKLKTTDLSDVVAVVTPLGLFFGRLANFVNAELVGRVTDSPWGMVFPGAGPYPRYPSQLIEAALEGLLLWLIMLFFAYRAPSKRPRGFLTGLFLTGYGFARFFSEYFREPELYYGSLADYITYGQLLTLPIMAVGIMILWKSTHAKATS